MNVTRPAINVQDSFFYTLRKDNILVEVTFLSERKKLGRIRRFDKYALVLEVEGREEMIYKHAIAAVTVVPGQALAGAPPRPALP